ncbi:phosphate regulon sensor histidine kinase PhoR [Granulosicoccaceae sp. 1_MG-2023]|nr:phosphate regulon sensor histidine kinase PhoR [Granulosicoccaceae sp. 1_MG-2023]
MNSTPWEAERWRLGLTLVLIAVIGLLSGHWLLAVSLPLLGYSLWNLYQLYCLERWLASGVKPGKAPEAGGIWAVIVQHIYRREVASKKRKKRYKDMLVRVNAAIDALPDAAVVLNSRNEIEWSNDGAQLLLGINKRRDAGSYIGNLLRLPEFREYLDNPGATRDFELQSPIDGNRVVAINLTPFGKKQSLMTARDVSQRVELTRVRKAFIANASHELRTPLTVIAGYLEILQSDPDLPEALVGPLQSAREQASRMESIIADLLTLSRLESSHLNDGDGDDVALSDLIRRIVGDLQTTVAGDTHSFTLDIVDEVCIRAIHMEIEGVVLNLCRNAILHTPPGTRVDVRLSLDQDGNVHFVVRDNGEGIPEEHLHRLTERFYRVDAGRSRAVGGTGLGLAITRHVMERCGGDLRISSTPGEYAQFEAVFPRKLVC